VRGQRNLMQKTNAKTLRKQMTDAERLLWKHLRNRQLVGCKFRRQHPIGPFIADFVCIEKRIIIEVDGSQHIAECEKDTKRSDYLKEKGFRVLRFWNNEVLQENEAVLNAIILTVSEDFTPLPQPSPPVGMIKTSQEMNAKRLKMGHKVKN
jgi:very-short-patch-repair endonuclease